MIQEVSRQLTGTYYAANTSIVFDSNPHLLAGNALTIYFNTNDFRTADTVVSVSGNTAIIGFSDNQYDSTKITASTPNFGSGLTGPQPTFSFKTTTPPNVIIQASVTGGSANVVLQASTDQNHWVNITTLALNSANANTAYTTMTSPWPYGRLNILDISANNSIAVNVAI